MVLESLISPLKAEKRPWELILIGFIYSIVAFFISMQIFSQLAGLVAVFLTVMASIPLMYAVIKFEEEKDLTDQKELSLLKEHGKALTAFFALFIGIFLAFSVCYIFLPEQTIETAFSLQISTIKNINSGGTGAAVYVDMFSRIFFNNLKVLLFCILFAFFYGAGALFILTWNASVIAVAVGAFVRTNISVYAERAGLFNAAAYFHIFSLGIARYMIHGSPEILAYFVGGLSGGIISIAIIRHDFMSKKFEKVLLDAADLLVIAIVLLLAGSFLEVFVTPALF